jgi:hypothetical protein
MGDTPLAQTRLWRGKRGTDYKFLALVRLAVSQVLLALAYGSF